METEILQTISGLGVGGILAAVFYNQNVKISQNYADQLKSLLEQERGRTDMLVGVIKEVTKALADNTAMTRAFHQRLDEDRERL